MPEEAISRCHARLERDADNHVLVVDLDSTNGSFVNGQRVKRHLLRDGDKIQIGDAAIFKFSYQDSAEDAARFIEYEKAIRDALTGVYGKMHFLARLADEFSDTIRRSGQLSVVLFNLDGYAQIAESFGDDTSNAVLRRLAEVASGTLREGDVFARCDEDEFAALLRDQNEETAYITAERVRQAIERASFYSDNQRIMVTISSGVATYKADNFEDPRELMNEARNCLYQAKRSGPNKTAGAGHS